MSKTTIIATIGPASLLARRRAVPVAERVTMVICAIAVLVSLAMLVRLNLNARADLMIGVAMLSAAAMRYSSRLQTGLRKFVHARSRLYVGTTGVAMAPVAVAIYFAVGNVLFARAGAPLYERAMTAFIGVYGAVVLAKTLVFA
ncbi:hypothetical protein QZM35_15520 [Burkholderia sp. AU45274]|uniref:hypothetical protein n=1 Tax=Burkholderia sp. AU45274 TaxID=3059205 RepID=UPI00264EA2C9|nr:hypothetical protein [Burkholderia sp. AU45274]MDN7489115.1 hypothetical protein [Burkholderia sp. AU45274]